jgi:dihydrofolate synthase / folylpolyglutamate synthase
MKYAEAIDFLYNLEHGSIKLGLERIEAAIAALDHPERRFLSVHVAGTNGKGTTATFLAAILEAAGQRTGLLTSPHLQAFGERIRVAGRMLPDDDIAALTAELRPLILELKLSYFEATTALAFEAFARRGVTAAVLEVGMGGRLDATNVIAPALTVVTGIDLDHTKALGSTRELIAREKAGIMKPGTPMLVADMEPAVHAVFERHGRDVGALVVALAERATLTRIEPDGWGTRFDLRRRDGRAQTRAIGLCGEHQARNGLLAEVGAELLGEAGVPIPDEAIARGLRAARWPGRFQILPDDGHHPSVILDVAHNPGGAETIVQTYRAWLPSMPPPALLVGMLADKDHAGFFRALAPLSAELHLVPLDDKRAGPITDIEAAARPAGFAPQVHADFVQAWTAAASTGRPVLVCGSFRTVEAAMFHLNLGPEQELFAWDPGPRDVRGARMEHSDGV